MPSDSVLVWLKPNYLGDAVMATPLMDALASSGMKTAVLAGNLVTDLLADRVSAVRFLRAGKISGVLPVLREAKRLRAMGFSATLLVNRSFRSALAARLARIPERVGFATEGRGFLLTEPVPYSPDRFEAECFLDLARAIGVEGTTHIPKLTVSDEERKKGFELLDGATVGLQPGARYPSKQLALERMAFVAKGLSERGAELALLGGPDEKDDAKRFQALTGTKVVDLVGTTSIRQTMGALANLSLMIGSDTGLMHVAAAVGCPTVTAFGPNPASKWGHRYAPHRVIEAPGGDLRRVSAQEVLAVSLSAMEAVAEQKA